MGFIGRAALDENSVGVPVLLEKTSRCNVGGEKILLHWRHHMLEVERLLFKYRAFEKGVFLKPLPIHFTCL